MLIIFVILYIKSLKLIHNFLAFDCLHPIPPSPSSTSGNHNSDLFSYQFVCLVLKYNWPTILCSSCYTKWWFNISIYFKSITIASIVTICHHTKYHKLLTIFPALYISYLTLFYNQKSDFNILYFLFTICLGVVFFGFILFETLWFPRLGYLFSFPG